MILLKIENISISCIGHKRDIEKIFSLVSDFLQKDKELVE